MSEYDQQPRARHYSDQYPSTDGHRQGHAMDGTMSSGGSAVSDANGHALTAHANRSVPSLGTQPGYDDSEPVPSLPPAYDPTAALESFHALHISDPVARASSVASGHAPSITSVASDSAGSYYTASSGSRHQNGRVPPVHANTLPPRPNPGRAYAADPQARQYAQSVNGYDPYTQNASNGYFNPDYRSQTPSYYGHQAQYGNAQPNAHAYQQGYNQYYSAASDVLGGGPPGPGAYAPPVDPNPASFDPRYAQSTVSVSSTGSGNAAGPGSRVTSMSSSSMTSGPPPDDDFDIERRPAVTRAGTTDALRTVKTKAIDLRAPPYTKQYIDEYRQRIKADPDPEAHFAYARYLIDAAKKIGADAKDQRAVRKYRDTLIQEALKTIRRLATQGQPLDEAQFFLANCYGTGMLGLQIDHEKAYHLYLQAAKQNHAAATYRVAVCNELGAGTRKDNSRAAAFYRKAASLGDTPAMYKLGMILLQGTLGEQPNPREAVGWLRRAAEQADEEYPHALHELALLHENPSGKVVQYDPNQARDLYTRAAQLGYVQSQLKLGQCYEYGGLGCPVDPRRSIAWYTKAAEKGNPEAELALSGWYLTGSEGVLKQSDSEAYLWARRAANKGLHKAEYAVGYYAEVGIGIKEDIDFAKRWYMRAAAQGNKRAMNRLTEMKRQGNKRTGANMARPTRQQAENECVIA